jgi:phage gpG-like protein
MDNEIVHGLDELTRRLDAAINYFEHDAKDVIGVESVKLFKQNFQEEGFNGQKWAARKTKRFGGTNSQKVLTKSGELSESITYKIDGDAVIIYSDKPYAEIHNEGGEITVTPNMKKYFWAQYYAAAEIKDAELMEQYKAMALAKKIVIPKREYIGESPQLVENITNKIVRDLTKILNG